MLNETSVIRVCRRSDFISHDFYMISDVTGWLHETFSPFHMS